MVQSVQRAIRLIEVISAEKEIGIRELSRQTGLCRSTVQRLVSVLVEEGFVCQTPATQKYHLSFKLFQLGSKAIFQVDLRTIARPVLEKMQAHVQETITVGAMDNGDIVYIDKLPGPQGPELAAMVGNRAPAHCTGTGKAILAFLPEPERKHAIQEKGLKAYTLRTITNMCELEMELANIRACGFAIDHEERFPGVVSLAAPVRNFQGKVVGAVGIPGSACRITAEKLPLISQYLLKAVHNISARLGYCAPEQISRQNETLVRAAQI